MKRTRRSVVLAVAINPAVLRAFRRAEKRRVSPNGTLRGNGLVGGQQGVLERLLVCYLRSDAFTRQKLVEAGYLFPGDNAVTRRRRFAAMATQIGKVTPVATNAVSSHQVHPRLRSGGGIG